MNILIVEPFYAGSHASWVDGIIRHSRHNVTALTLPGRSWKWRMHGGSVALAGKFNSLKERPGLILATDMLDLSSFLALTRSQSYGIPVFIYFHENQLTYPWSPSDSDIFYDRDRHYGFINYISALSADGVFFNSQFHRDSFLSSLPDFLKGFPDYQGLDTVETIRNKSSVLPLGIDLERLDLHRPVGYDAGKKEEGMNAPLLLWNHRWEYDKNPGSFFNALYRLEEEGYEFRAAILGESYREAPHEFEEARKRLGPKIIKFGYAKSVEEYARWLWSSDILPVTSIQDFFGISIIEALYCGCLPCLPSRLAYPEIIPFNDFNEYFYNDEDDFFRVLKNLFSGQSKEKAPFREIAERYAWKNMIDMYDGIFESISQRF